MIKKTNNSGWILCPSKSYPGKFYYFNVLNGEAAWSLNDNEKKGLKKEVTIQKLKYNHLYPKPLTPPDHPSPETSNHSTIRKPLPTFGQATFPKYISNVKNNMATIWKPIQMPQLFTNTKKTLDQNTQTEQDNINIHTCTIPLSKRFENKRNKNSINYVSNPTKDWWNSTNIWSNIGKHSVTPKFQCKRKLDTKPLLKESKIKRLQCSIKKDAWNTSACQYSTQLHSNKAEIPEAITNQSFINLDINDLRFVLRAKKRKSVDMRDLDNKFSREHTTLDTKKVAFGDNNKFYSDKKNSGTSTKYTNNENQQAWYLVVDLDVILEDYDCINHYIEEDENCHLYIPSVIRNQLKTLSLGEHRGRSHVILARQLLRQLESNMPKSDISENKENTTTLKIIKCCLEIMKRNNNVVLITKDIELLHTAKLHQIRSHHIDDIKYNDLRNIHTFRYKQNLFLQNKSDFDPFIISKSVYDDNYLKQNITDINRDECNNTKSLINDVSHVNEINCDISDINMNISRLDINDKIYNIKRKVKNNLFDYQISQSNDIYKKIYHTISINKTFSNRNDNFDEVFENKKETHDILEDMLKKFNIKNNIMEHNLYMRFDEWICTYEQILEDFLYIILQNYPQRVNQPPWFLHEGMECLQEMYRDNRNIVNIIEKLLHYYDFSSENGTNTKPYNFMKLFACGLYLVEALENTSPLYISDIKNKLNYLKDMLELPIEDLLVESPIRNNTEDGRTYRYNFVKNPSYVLDYLKKHFSEWKDYNEDYNNEDEKQQVKKDNIKVLRTCGRHLNKLTINKSKCISFIKETDKQTRRRDFQSNNLPKVIRNVKLLNTFEEKIKENNSEYINKPIIIDNVEDSEIISINNDSQKNDSSINDNNEINDSTKDSGFESNSLHAYSLVRNFLSELSLSFKVIHTFIDESIKNYSQDIAEESKKDLYDKANKTHTHVAEIIDKLKIIIQRESMGSSTLKSLLIKSGSDDKRTTRYRPVVMKCLEQATVLKKSLRLMLAVTNEEMASESSNENMHFINIYE